MALKSNYGQYFTQDTLSDFVVDETLKVIPNPKSALEPSFGDGQFVKSLLKRLPDIQVDACEIDPEVFVEVEGANCVVDDFLLGYDTEKKYPLIIGNPPYIEVVYSFYNEEQQKLMKDKFEKKGRGRINLVHGFFDKSFKLLEEGGVISYLLPSAILTSPWYNDIRKTIYEDYTIHKVVEDVKFKGVSIKVSLLIIQKQKTDVKKYIVKKGDVYQIFETVSRKQGMTLKDLGFTVGVGPYYWAHHKPLLNNDELGKKLLYSSFISENLVQEVEIKNPLKKKYINITQPKVIKDSILLPRSSSKKFKVALLENNETFVFENHVIYITHKDKKTLKLLYKYLFNNKSEVESILNSANITKTEVENIVWNK